MEVLLTGGCGFIGSHIAHKLVEDDFEVLIIDNLSRGDINRIRDIQENVEFKKIDLRNKDKLEEIFPRKDETIVIHTAAQVSVNKSIEDPCYDALNNIIGTLNILALSLKYNVIKFIHFSSAAIYGNPKYIPIDEEHPKNPISPYGISKLSSEYYSLTYDHLYGLKVVVLRPFNVYGPGQNPDDPYAGVITIFVSRVLNDKPPIVFGGHQTRDLVNVKDVVFATMLAIKENVHGEPFNIASGSEVSISELANIIIKAANKPNLKPIYESMRPGDIERSVANIDKAKKLLGYHPNVKLYEGIKEVVEWMKLHK